MDFNLTSRQRLLKEAIREFMKGECDPVATLEFMKKKQFPWEIYRKAGENGYLASYYPKELGGQGLPLLDYCLLMEEMIRYDHRIGMALSLGSIPAKTLLRFGNEEQKKKYLPKLTRGEAVASIAVTEPNHGSDIRFLDTRAEKKGDEYIITGNKIFITNADIADVYTVFAQTNPDAPPYRGMSGFIVERETEGVTAIDLGDKIGLRTTSSCNIELREVKVHKNNLLGKENHGFTYIMEALNEGRAEIANQAIGLARGAYDRALFHAKNREQFGQKIGKFQNISHMIVEMSEEIESAALLAYKSVWLIDQKKKDLATCLQAKVKCTLTAIDVCLKAMQILAGYGLFEEQFITGYLGDALATWLLEGTGQMQRNTVASQILGKL
ncbi:MAG: acyl-CoA dehydrogenase family protein [Thermodesulfobacteriota bacterium]|nr:acyl-CoA dehydrogenase family protein [Thermodesulfobacteriota bacterium]